MAMTDPIADLLTRIRNAALARHDTATAPASNTKEAILRILRDEGYIKGYERISKTPQDDLVVVLKYGAEGHPAIKGLERTSTPGRRVYVGATELPRVLHGLGVAIISTSHGVLPDHIARKKKIGGEVLCKVW